MFIIGICGASGSGKSTLAQELENKLDCRCVIIKQDSYYKDHSDLTFEERTHINYDEPDAFEHRLLRDDLIQLHSGKAITSKDYDFARHMRNDQGNIIEPADIVIVEGIHTFFDPEIRDLMDLKIYVQVDIDVCLLRRVKRDMRERGRALESICDQYLDTVKPMYEKYIRGYSEHADLIVPRGGKNDKIINMLSTYIRENV